MGCFTVANPAFIRIAVLNHCTRRYRAQPAVDDIQSRRCTLQRQSLRIICMGSGPSLGNTVAEFDSKKRIEP